MTFGEAVASALNKYATFRGRARRAEYWWFMLFNALVSVAAQILDAILFFRPGIMMHGTGAISALIGLALLLPWLAVWCRRLHDVGRSGWWWLLLLVPMIGVIVLFYWAVRRGDVGPNAYGPDPIGGSGGYAASDIPRVMRH